MAGRLSEQDRKDLEKFMKFFIFKSLQIIVQSRLGEKLRSKSKVTSSGADWVRKLLYISKQYVVNKIKTGALNGILQGSNPNRS